MTADSIQTHSMLDVPMRSYLRISPISALKGGQIFVKLPAKSVVVLFSEPLRKASI